MSTAPRMDPVHVLLVIDDDDAARHINDCLSDMPDEPVRIDRTASVAEFVARDVVGVAYDCVLVDTGATEASGTAAIRAVAGAAPELPIVALVDPNRAGLGTNAVRAGADDHLPKGDQFRGDVARRVIDHTIDRAAFERALRESRRDLREFAHRMGHDIKSPLSVVLGSIELLQRAPRADPDDDSAAEIVEMLGRSGRRLLETVDRLVEYADALSAEHVDTEVDLDGAIDWAIQTLDSALDDVRVQVQRPLPRVWGDEVGARHVFLNLLSNSVAFAHDDRPIRVDVAVEAANRDDHVVVSVTDDGPGVPPEHREAVFRAGHRVDDAGPGTGLGLATVHQTMERFGGSVVLEAGPGGVGTRIVLEMRRTN